MFELPALPAEFAATRARRRRAHVVRGPVGNLCANDAVRIAEVESGQLTGRVDYALVTHVEPLTTPFGLWHVVSFELRGVSSDSMRALRGIPTPVPTGD